VAGDPQVVDGRASLTLVLLLALLLLCRGAPAAAQLHHYEYVVPDQAIYVYDEDNNFALVKQISLPQVKGTRGLAASPGDGMLYIAFGGDGGPYGNGSLLKYDLLHDTVVWQQNYPTGIDSMSISRDGKRIYMPVGELATGGNYRLYHLLDGGTADLYADRWSVIDAGTGRVVAGIPGGEGPHNTIVSIDDRHVYLGSRYYNYLLFAETANNRVVRQIGPLVNTVRPFTINGSETIAYTTATSFLGFQASDIKTGRVLYTINGFGPLFPYDPATFPASCPSHGISLSPDERELYVLDSPNSYVHVFDVSLMPASPPKQVADIPLHPMVGDEADCLYDCTRDGWVQHSRDGRFVFVGDSGDVIDTARRTVVANLQPLQNTRKHLEITWRNGVPISTSTRSGLGYVRR
jgi:DNA-binding beta-propeller fold protein YncE